MSSKDSGLQEHDNASLSEFLIYFYCNFSMYNILYHTCTYNHLPEDEPSGLKHVEDIIN